MFYFRKYICIGFSGLAIVAAPLAQAAPITFTATDYDNSPTQTFGFFRDIYNGGMINSGLDLGGAATAGCPATSCSSPGTNNALNFTGEDNNASPKGRVTIFDTTPIDGTVKNLFSGDMTMSADILISRFNNGKGAGLVTLFNEGAGNTGLALFLTNAGNSDSFSIKLEQQTGVDVTNLSNVALGNVIAQDTWYRLVLDLDFNGPDFTVTGKIFSHSVATDPNSALGGQVGATLTHTDFAPWDAGLSNPYEIGLVARGVSAVVDTSVTNFDFTNGVVGRVPEPGTFALLGLGLAGFLLARRKAAA